MCVVGFLVLNAVSFWLNRPGPLCNDCVSGFGFPFPAWEYGGFIGVGRPIWRGLVSDLVLLIAFAGLATAIARRSAR